MKKLMPILLGAALAGCASSVPTGTLIILQAGDATREGSVRALHALLYAEELAEAGQDVVLMFDGAGTVWAQKLRAPDHRLHAKYEALKARGVVREICDHCAGAFKVREDLREAGEPLVAGFGGHPSLRKWTDRGYRVLIL